jgi:hypothetical protein
VVFSDILFIIIIKIMSKKVIEINPTLFRINGLSKTKKKHEKINNATPIISPNVLKNKLLKRIKEHKLKETQKIETENKNVNTNKPDLVNKPNLVDLNLYTSEFNDSINYFKSLSDENNKNKINKNNQHLKEKI